jgi:hypothetical protein
MSDTHSDLVIQISPSNPESDASGAKGEEGNESRLVRELRQCLRPGVEIALVFRGYTAITSILWLSGPLPEGGLRAGVRLLGVSAPATGQAEPAPSWDDAPRVALPVQLASSTMRQLS